MALTHLKKLFVLLKTNKNYDIKLISAKALAKITKILGKLMEPHQLKEIFGGLTELIYLNNKIGIFICKSLSNLITNHGDIKTNKSTSKSFFYFRQYLTIL